MRSREIQTELRRDLTERQRAENALVEEKERLRVTLSCIGDAVITTDTCGKVTYLNPVAEIQKALEEERFVLYSQKILPLADGAENEAHYELLLRM